VPTERIVPNRPLCRSGVLCRRDGRKVDLSL